jgi:uncharacterized membrane protein
MSYIIYFTLYFIYHSDLSSNSNFICIKYVILCIFCFILLLFTLFYIFVFNLYFITVLYFIFYSHILYSIFLYFTLSSQLKMEEYHIINPTSKLLGCESCIVYAWRRAGTNDNQVSRADAFTRLPA